MAGLMASASAQEQLRFHAAEAPVRESGLAEAPDGSSEGQEDQPKPGSADFWKPSTVLLAVSHIVVGATCIKSMKYSSTVKVSSDPAALPKDKRNWNHMLVMVLSFVRGE